VSPQTVARQGKTACADSSQTGLFAKHAQQGSGPDCRNWAGDGTAWDVCQVVSVGTGQGVPAS
jgi:hypothetical protein